MVIFIFLLGDSTIACLAKLLLEINTSSSRDNRIVCPTDLMGAQLE